LVRDQLFVHVGGGVIVAERLRLSFNLPVLAYTAGEQGRLGIVTYVPPSKATIGDLRVGADVRLAGQFGDPFTMALGVQVQIPTGDRDQYASDGKVRVVPRLLGAGEIGPFVYALKIGAQ